MAVRNMDAIQRQGKMIAQQRANERKMREESFWQRVNTIRVCHDDAVDFIDTVDALVKNGLREKFEAWMQRQNVYYYIGHGEFSVQCSGEFGKSRVKYSLEDDDVKFCGSAPGGCYNLAVSKNRWDQIINEFNDRGHGFDDGLTKLAVRLQPFLTAFFEWVETI